MIRRKLNTEKCGCCCTLKEKLQYLWDHTMGAILKVNDITPDGDGKFTIEAGTNIALTEISNGLRIDTTGGVSYYSAGDTYVDVDNNDLEISLVDPGQSGGVALHDDLEVVATGLTNLLNGGNVGSDTKPVKFVNGVAVPVTDDLSKVSKMAYIVYSGPINITTANTWQYHNGTVTVPSDNPYMRENAGRIEILEAGVYNITLLLSTSSGYQSVVAGGVRHQNIVTGTQIAFNQNLNVGDIVTVAVYTNVTGNMNINQYNGLNQLTIAKL